MEDITRLDNLKILLDKALDETDEDSVLTLYLNRAENYVKSFCNITELNSELIEIAEDIAVFNYRNKSVENLVSEGKGSLSETYREDLPPDIIRKLNNHKRLRFI
ncbi:phage head-tail connector protein [Sutcliffiella horikoshii]|uniref:phage head-tail connector protein n=1 Tax=Sutcliffiella horikoshii TaxID=79883 RepID=UPI003850A431